MEKIAMFEKALDCALKGCKYGQFMAGIFYEFGIGVERNITESIVWYKKAMAQGESYSKEALERLGYEVSVE